MEADREFRIKQRVKRQKELEAIVKAREDTDKAVQELLSLEPDILAGDDTFVSETEIEDLLAIDIVAEDISDEEMADFDQEDAKDGDKAMDKLATIQCPFDIDDLDFWFTELEGQLELIDIKSQWSKRMALQKLLPLDVKAEIKTLLRLSKTAAGNDIYFRMKQELIDIFGKKPEDDYIRAKNRVLGNQKPSQLGKKLIDDICPGDVKLQGCHCSKTVWAMFREQMPIVIRNHLSEMTFSKDTCKSVFAKADQVWASNNSSEPNPRPSVAAIQSEQPEAETAAIGRGRGTQSRGRGGPRNRGGGRGGRGGSNTSTPATTPAPTTSTKPKGTRHATAKGKDESLCKIHFNWGVNATYCAAPWKCPMKDTWKAPQ